MKNAVGRTRVVKKMSATQPGALKLARRFGEALVCVRYRHDAEGQRRYTTVELVVDHAPIANRKPVRDRLVAVHIPFNDPPLRRQAQALGARWDEQVGIWRMLRSTAKQLKLLKQIVEK